MIPASREDSVVSISKAAHIPAHTDSVNNCDRALRIGAHPPMHREGSC